MAKGVRGKKPEVVKGEDVIETVAEPIIEAAAVVVEEKVDEVVMEEPKVEVPVEKPIQVSEYKPLVQTDELPLDERLVLFIESRDGNDVKLNDFIKATYGVPKFNEPPKWTLQGESKRLKGILDAMVKSSKIVIQNDNHLKLGTFYYPDTTTGKTHYHNLHTIQLVAKK